MAPIAPAVSAACLQAREHISARLDGELDQLGTIRLRVHLAGCAQCRSFQRELESIIARLRTAEPVAVPARARPRRSRPARATALGVVALAAASAAAIVLVLPAGNGVRPGLAVQGVQWHADPAAYDHATRMA